MHCPQCQQRNSDTAKFCKECGTKLVNLCPQCGHQANPTAKSWELRAVMSLARLWQSQSKKDEARQMLAEVYHWFTEGFDTADLRDAKVLLEELSS